MDAWLIVVIVVVALLVLAGIAWMAWQKNRSSRLRRDFGPEYERAVNERGNRGKAESELQARARRVEKLQIRTLDQTDAKRYSEQWSLVQSHFVDDPKGAIADADKLVLEVMNARGYPMSDFEQRAADISVDHPKVVSNYRTAHGISESSDRGEASTEDLRQAMVHYRALFEDLLETREPEKARMRR